MAAKTYHGSCACGKVKYEATLDLAAGTFKCNCASCTKSRFWGAMVKPEAVQVVSGEGDLTAYQRNLVNHHFCKHCGIKTFGRAEIPAMGGKVVAINLGALDDLPAEEWAAAPVQYMDGRHDDWFQAPAFTGHM